jgi:hypothetical protein
MGFALPCVRYSAERPGKSVETRVSVTDGGELMPRALTIHYQHDRR